MWRKVGGTEPFTGPQSMRNQPERTDRVRAHWQNSQITGVHSGRSVSPTLAQAMAGERSLLAFHIFADRVGASPRPLRLGSSSAGQS
jgi:hypothetical protein